MKSDLIKKIIDENRLVNRIKENPSSCPCYQGVRCHNHLSDYEMICLFCVCPEYDKSKLSGECKIEKQENLPTKGKWFYHKDLQARKIWDCSDCTLPHTEKFVEKYLNNLSIPQLKKIKNCKDISSLWDFFKDVSWG